MIRDITIGQYYPAQSQVHRLDPRVKIVCTLAFLVSLFLQNSILGYVVAFVFLAMVIRLSKVPVKFIVRGLKPIVILLLFTVLMNLFLTKTIWKRFQRLLRQRLKNTDFLFRISLLSRVVQLSAKQVLHFTKLAAKKEIPNVRTYVSVDGGMTDNIRYALYQSAYTVVNAGKADKEPDEIVTVAGKCCESGDLVQEHTKVAKVEVGDTLAVLSTGAYNYSMASKLQQNPSSCNRNG